MTNEEIGYVDNLQECVGTAKERNKSYSTPDESYAIAQKILLDQFGLDMKQSDMIKVMIAIKRSRETICHKEDNLIDEINYTAILLDFLRKGR